MSGDVDRRGAIPSPFCHGKHAPFFRADFSGFDDEAGHVEVFLDQTHDEGYSMDLEQFILNRNAFSHEELARMVGKLVARSPDGLRILAF